jgi:hypothetical protein
MGCCHGNGLMDRFCFVLSDAEGNRCGLFNGDFVCRTRGATRRSLIRASCTSAEGAWSWGHTVFFVCRSEFGVLKNRLHFQVKFGLEVKSNVCTVQDKAAVQSALTHCGRTWQQTARRFNVAQKRPAVRTPQRSEAPAAGCRVTGTQEV